MSDPIAIDKLAEAITNAFLSWQLPEDFTHAQAKAMFVILLEYINKPNSIGQINLLKTLGQHVHYAEAEMGTDTLLQRSLRLDAICREFRNG